VHRARPRSQATDEAARSAGARRLMAESADLVPPPSPPVQRPRATGRLRASIGLSACCRREGDERDAGAAEIGCRERSRSTVSRLKGKCAREHHRHGRRERECRPGEPPVAASVESASSEGQAGGLQARRSAAAQARPARRSQCPGRSQNGSPSGRVEGTKPAEQRSLRLRSRSAREEIGRSRSRRAGVAGLLHDCPACIDGRAAHQSGRASGCTHSRPRAALGMAQHAVSRADMVTTAI